MQSYRLTTVDNPFNPVDEFEEWYRFDIEKGYYTASLLARMAHTSDALSKQENEQIIMDAIDEIIRLDFMHIYKIVQITV